MSTSMMAAIVRDQLFDLCMEDVNTIAIQRIGKSFGGDKAKSIQDRFVDDTLEGVDLYIFNSHVSQVLNEIMLKATSGLYVGEDI
jgi:hypothetical protein